FRLQASGFRLQASGFRLQASGFRLQASGFRLQASGFRLQASGKIGGGLKAAPFFYFGPGNFGRSLTTLRPLFS
ncbi:MAG: hypothetical protein Q8K67_01740, partial [Geothrix sp.]|nr:hypothetical protein [Geothrix sp.]